MDTSKDYYRILEVHPQASAEMIERAKRLLLQRYHPDKNPDRPDWASERTRLVLEAYKTLSDAESRREYDALRREERSGPRRTRASTASDGRDSSRTSSGRPRRASPRPGRRPRAGNRPPVKDNAPPGFKTVVCGVCGRPSQVRDRRPLYSVICGGCGHPVRRRLLERVKTRLRRIDDGLERLRSGLLSVLARAGIPAPRRTKEKSSQ